MVLSVEDSASCQLVCQSLESCLLAFCFFGVVITCMLTSEARELYRWLPPGMKHGVPRLIYAITSDRATLNIELLFWHQRALGAPDGPECNFDFADV